MQDWSPVYSFTGAISYSMFPYRGERATVFRSVYKSVAGNILMELMERS